jgi:hypothetical protein
MSTPQTGAVLGRILQGSSGARQPTEQAMGLSLGALRRHLLAVGGTGSGKTVALKVVAEDLLARWRVPIIAFDVLGDFGGLLLPLYEPALLDRYGLTSTPEVRAQMETAQHQRLAHELRRVMAPWLLTPRSRLGIQLSVSPLVNRPFRYDEIRSEDPAVIGDLALACAHRIYAALDVRDRRNANHLASQIESLWDERVDIEGPEGLGRFRERLADKLEERVQAGLLNLGIGPGRHDLEGVTLDLDRMVRESGNRVPLIVVSLEHLQAERVPAVVSSCLQRVVSWAQAQPALADGAPPHIAVLLDELSSGEPRNALLPPSRYTVSSPSAAIIRTLLRRGRHWGVTMLCGTQAPSDVGGAMANNFYTRVIGALRQPQQAAAALAGVPAERLKDYVAEVARTVPGQMLTVSARDQHWCQVRLPVTHHGRLDQQQLRQMAQDGWLASDADQSPLGKTRHLAGALDDLYHQFAGRVPNGLGEELRSLRDRCLQAGGGG